MSRRKSTQRRRSKKKLAEINPVPIIEPPKPVNKPQTKGYNSTPIRKQTTQQPASTVGFQQKSKVSAPDTSKPSFPSGKGLICDVARCEQNIYGRCSIFKQGVKLDNYLGVSCSGFKRE